MQNIVYRYGNRKMYSTLHRAFVIYEEVLRIPNVKVVCHKSKLDITDKILCKGRLLKLIKENEVAVYG